MNKLLLLATSLICLSMRGYTAEIPQQKTGAPTIQTTTNDSSIKEDVLSNPKESFKDLFETGTENGINITKLNPKAVSFVQDYVEAEGTRLIKMKSWGKPYFDMISNILVKHNLPIELKYLSVIESDLKSSATSWAGAVGPWQLMPETARDFGLIVSKKRDDRRDYFKSTNAAARYLSDLYSVYNDWLLVIAAYNCGAGNVNSAIRKSGSRNFWDLQYYLPAESRNHVKKFIATHYIMEGDAGMTTLTRKETDELGFVSDAVDPNTTVLNITGKYNSFAIAQSIQMDLAAFLKMNPNFDKQLSANGSYGLRLPLDKMNLFQLNKQQILEQSIRILLGTANR
jgi:membrane-bound lytic murein transglycosylase D